jgi:hypothetical protein
MLVVSTLQWRDRATGATLGCRRSGSSLNAGAAKDAPIPMSTLNARVDLPPPRSPRRRPAAWRASCSPAGKQTTAVRTSRLLVSEIVTNAVNHAGEEASLELELSLFQGWLRVSLADGSSIHPQLRELDPTDPTLAGPGCG